MIKNHLARRTIAVFFLLNFLSTLIPYNGIYANNTGPNAPEAASFEPVDATDMVNLLTGDFTYVLPLLNIPSPEGGYPISLAYHAGIAMDQEASWVGLGWNLNPGAINRNVNGQPDDWGKTSINEFFYDKGWTENYYSISFGSVFSSGMSVGLGLSWGSNKSLSGSIALGIGGVNIDINDNGVNAGLGLGGASGISLSLATNGIAAGYGFSNQNSSAKFGVSSNGGASLTMSNRSLGVSLSSNGASFNVSRGGKLGGGIGFSNESSGLSNNDYDITVKSSGFSLPMVHFYIGYNHTQVNYSLFKNKEVFTSGMLYPVEANETWRDQNNNPTTLMNENNFMDSHYLMGYEDHAGKLLEDGVGKINYFPTQPLVLPSYDKFNVQAQGISGTMKTYNNSELTLSPRTLKNFVYRTTGNSFVYETRFYNHDIQKFKDTNPSPEVNLDAVSRKEFRFSDAYNSFYRLDNVIPESLSTQVTKEHEFFSKIKTENSGLYDNSGSLISNRRREGNNITYFTNKEIREGNISNFIEAKQKESFLNRANTSVFVDEGIGAFKIKAIDGKTYHYSLPVYQMESYYKTFKDRTNEDKNFVEIVKEKPYATHWLLTGITGPDYIDNNNNGKLDSDDYGYWVEFEYGKWSEGYGWRFPKEGYDKIIDETEEAEETYSYSYGRKEIYYLDAIKTRTHTALFIKEVREDDKSITISEYSRKGNYGVESNNYVINSHINAKKLNTGKESGDWLDIDFPVYTGSGFVYNDVINLSHLTKPFRTIYRDIPSNYALKLNKILLINNKRYSYNSEIKSNNYSSGKQMGYKVGFISNTRYGFKSLRTSILSSTNYPDDNTLYRTPLEGKLFKGNIGQNILDVNDIEVSSLEQLSDKVISFNYDYSLAKKSFNDDFGKLTLTSVETKGKGGAELIPPFKFGYQDSYVRLDNTMEDDWGYHKDHPAAWSLNKITTPTGAEIKIEHEADSYLAEAAAGKFAEFSFDNSNLNGSSTVFNVKDEDFNSIKKYFKVGETYLIQTKDLNSNGGNPYDYQRSKLVSIAEDQGKIHLGFEDNVYRSFGYSLKILPGFEDFTIKYDDLNGKKGGGIRVKKISVSDQLNKVSLSTNYKYTDINNKITGITSYEPSEKQKFVPYQSLLPPPLVMYGKVSLSNVDKNDILNSSTSYEFEMIEPRSFEDNTIFSLGELFKIKKNQSYTGSFRKGYSLTNGIVSFNSNPDYSNEYNMALKKFTIINKLSNIGRLKSVEHHNAKNQLISKTTNNYKKELDSNNEIGVNQETYNSFRQYYGTRSGDFNVTSKIDYPSVLESVEEVSNGTSSTKYFDKYDFLTGQVLETRSYSSDGKAYKSKMIPAYTKYAIMGSQIDNGNNKNMLTQSAGEVNYIFKNDQWKEIEASATTWKNSWIYPFNNGSNESSIDVWRIHESYIWNGESNSDGTFQSYSDFNYSNASSNSNWELTSTVTKYNQFSQTIEVKDVNNNYASTKMGDNYTKVIASSNAAYEDMYYSGAEYLDKNNSSYFDGGIKSLGYKNVGRFAHTGKYIVEVLQNQKGFETVIPNRIERNTPLKQRFKVSVWVKKGGENNAKILFNGSEISFNDNEKVYAGNWVLLNGYVTIPQNGANISITSISGSIELDDFRLHPVRSNMTSYVYNTSNEVSYIIGSNGLASHYIYDKAGRLVETYIEVVDKILDPIVEEDKGGFKKISTNSYNYKRNYE
ncbi:hypothetical protein [Tenacibaculum sp. 190524A05c]|uniref:hypothetical protein n=1 Tax=Tenacibaculum platacis TaxID=3137852 RepID=UPI0031FB3A97